MLLRRLILCAVVWSLGWPAAAQEIFSSPFRDANTYLELRGEASNATRRYRYEMVTEGLRPGTTEVIIDVASDWSVVEVVLSAAAPDLNTQDPCDIATELGVLLPGAASSSRVSESDGVTVFRCNDRTLGSFSLNQSDPPPAAFWPTLRALAPLHPDLFRRIREAWQIPQLIEATLSPGGGATTSHRWRLIGEESIDRPYPLIGSTNATAAAFDLVSAPGVGQVAAEAVAGIAAGGAPTLQSWSIHLATVGQEEGRAAAAMLLGPTLNMFPELNDGCRRGQAHAACELIADLRNIAQSDLAVMSLFEIGIAEQQGDGAAALAAMERSRTSQRSGHVVIGAAYALAILRFDRQTLERATALGLPTDPGPLTLAAIRAYPYNPAYWTDYGDRLRANYRLPEALLFYDVAYSLPTSSPANEVLRSKAATFERIRRDFPDFSLPTSE